MIVTILSLLDFVCAAVLIAGYFLPMPSVLVIHSAAYLIIKGLVFHSALVSWIDVGIGIWLLITLFGVNHIISILAGIWLLAKSISGTIALGS